MRLPGTAYPSTARFTAAPPDDKAKRKIPPVTPDEGKRIVDLLDDAIYNFTGTVDELEQALGFYLLGRHIGWRALVVVHNKRTIRKYEGILGIDIREAFPEVGADAERSMGYSIASKLSNFWKAVSGEEKIPERRQIQ